MNTAAQDQWVEIAQAVRAHLARMVELIPAMKPDEVKTLVDTIDTAMWLEAKAESHDAAVEERLRSLERQAQYGG